MSGKSAGLSAWCNEAVDIANAQKVAPVAPGGGNLFRPGKPDDCVQPDKYSDQKVK
jgi:hypothetical protein